MTCDIFIVSCDKDAEWLSYCLQSIAKFGTGFNAPLVAIPEGHAHAMRVAHSAGATIQPFVEAAQKFSQVQTLMHTCHKHGCMAEYVLQVDSDCHFFRPTKPLDFFEKEKPVLMIQSYASLIHDGFGQVGQWRKASEETLGFPTPYETMRAPGRMFPTWVFPEVEEYIVERHGMPLDRYICSRPGGGYEGRNDYAEFNVIGAYVLKFHPDKFLLHDTGARGWRDWPVKQKWSYAGVASARAELEQLLGNR